MTTEDLDIPDFPIASDKAIRRAVARGVFRVAFVAACFLFGAAVFGGLLSWGAQDGFGRGARFARVAGLGWAVSHPTYAAGNLPPALIQSHPIQASGGVGVSYFGLWAMPAVAPITAAGEGGAPAPAIRQNLLGRIRVYNNPNMSNLERQTLSVGLDPRDGRTIKAEELRYIDSLPRPMTAAAVIEFSHPLSQAEFDALAWPVGLPAPDNPFRQSLSILLTGSRVETLTGARPYNSRDFGMPLAWPRPVISEFQSWIRSLNSSDSANLRVLGLPPLSELQDAAGHALIHGVVLGQLPLAQIRTLAANPLIRAVRIGDLAFSPAASVIEGPK